MQGAIGCKCCIKVTNSRLATAQVDLTNRKYWAPWAPEDYWVGAHPDKKKSSYNLPSLKNYPQVIAKKNPLPFLANRKTSRRKRTGLFDE